MTQIELQKTETTSTPSESNTDAIVDLKLKQLKELDLLKQKHKLELQHLKKLHQEEIKQLRKAQKPIKEKKKKEVKQKVMEQIAISSDNE